MGRIGSATQRAAPLYFLRQTNQVYKKEGNFSPKEAVGMKEAGSYRF